MPPIFKKYKSAVDDFLLQFLESKKDTLSAINTFGPDLLNRVKKVTVSGKTIRGALVLFAYCFTNKKPSEDAIKAAAAMELFQTALIIHDDIMDGDLERRGMPTMHIQYNSESLAMCVGDVLFFLAFELMGSIRTDAATLGRLIRLVGREYQAVGVAQMEDVAKKTKTREEVLSLYTYKTARYTFALPLMLGATLAGTTKDMLKYLESFGVSAGVLFQIRDDTLDRETRVGSKEINAYQTAAEESIVRLSISENNKKILRNLLHFVLTRTT